MAGKDVPVGRAAPVLRLKRRLAMLACPLRSLQALASSLTQRLGAVTGAVGAAYEKAMPVSRRGTGPVGSLRPPVGALAPGRELIAPPHSLPDLPYDPQYVSAGMDWAWFIGSSALLLSLPILVEVQRETTVLLMQRQREMEAAQMQEQAKLQAGGVVEQVKGLGALLGAGLGGGSSPAQ